MVENGHFLGNLAITRAIIKFFFYFAHPKLEQTVFGIKFDNPVGLSAGFDKDAELLNIIPSVGFGFMSVGSITAAPYDGNPRPWLTRFPQYKSILVNYGLKNIGVDKIIERIKKSRKTIPLFVSIAKTNCKETITPEAGVNDYMDSLKKLETNGVGDVYELNISCPNAYGGEPFTTPDLLNMLLSEITTLQIKKPIVVKMPINLPWEEFQKLLDVILKFNIAGVIIGNLNKDRTNYAIPADLKGNMSGKPTFELSNELISKTYKYCGTKLVIIGTGGIFSTEDAYEKIKRGATLVQLITGMLFEGPALIGNINEELVRLAEKDGYSSISQAIGTLS